VLADVLELEFMRHAVAAAVLASVLCGVLGTFVVVKRLVFLSGGVSHAAFGGLGVCYYLGLDPRLGAAASAIAVALVLSGGRSPSGPRLTDATIGVLWAAGMAVGIVFLYRTPGYVPDLTPYLFGNLLTVGGSDVVGLALLVAIVLAFVLLLFKELVAVAFDETFAEVQGVPVRPLVTALMVLVALAVVLLIQVVGILLVIALLTIPPLVALRFVRRFEHAMLTATAVALVMTLGGLAFAYALDLPSGASIVLLGTVVLLAVHAPRPARASSTA
jgi:zinc transport system permease protein